MKFMYSLILVCLAFLLCSCVFEPVKLKVDYGRFDMPETMGKKKFYAGVSVSNTGTEVVFKENEQALVNVIDPKINDKKGTIALSVGYGVLDRLDIGAKILSIDGLFSIPSPVVYIKAMLIGKPFSAAKKGDYSLSVSVGRGNERFEVELDVVDNVDSNQADYSVITGYRLTDHILLYGGAFRSEFDYQFVDGYKYDGLYMIKGINLGVNHTFSSNELNISYEVILTDDNVVNYGIKTWFVF